MDRGRFKPEEWERPDDGSPARPSPDDAVLPEDHPLARLFGHDPTIMKGLGAAFALLGEHTEDEALRGRLHEMADGTRDVREILVDEAFGREHRTGPDTADDLTEALGARSAEDDPGVGEAVAEAVARHKGLADEVRARFGFLES
jgi:hypothetical protein